MYYPIYRPRRLRRTESIRRMVRETVLHIDDLIYPLFVTYGRDKKEEISTMPGCFRFSIDNITKEVKEASELDIPAIILFGIPDKKDDIGSEAYNPKGVVQEAIRAIKEDVPGLIVITDVCIDEYTTHGHCGVIRDGEIDNDATLELLAQMALSHAQAGADMVAPSDMMDGRVKAIRAILDEHGFQHIPIMSYAAKYASSFYGPFREAADSAPKFGDRKSYQMDMANSREAMREIKLDIEEGADIIMVKPALPYLDIIWQARQKFDLPIAAYNVSGEYAMIKAASKQGWLVEERVILESLACIKRAGADLILTYFAKDAAHLLRK
jgi:porphobilinogen synthase